MIIEKKEKFLSALQHILLYIGADKPSAALRFADALNKQIENLIHFPYKYRKSHYFDDEAYRDMVFKGYTVIYKVEPERIIVLDIFKWQSR